MQVEKIFTRSLFIVKIVTNAGIQGMGMKMFPSEAVTRGEERDAVLMDVDEAHRVWSSHYISNRIIYTCTALKWYWKTTD